MSTVALLAFRDTERRKHISEMSQICKYNVIHIYYIIYDAGTAYVA
jgi:hypothetical protein